MMEGEATPAAIDWADPAWFPADLDVRGGRIAMLHIDPEVVERSTFLDTRIAADLQRSLSVDARALPGNLPSAPPVAWLFHTSFCCSTLLAQALHDHPSTVAYREPLVLRRLADARHEGLDLGRWPKICTDLLARPWSPRGRIVVKPTHAALNIGQMLMQASADSRAIALTSSLSDFLVSNVKKAPETQARIPLLVEMSLSAGQFHRRLPIEALSPPSLIAAAGLQWAAQRELLVEMAERVGAQRLAALDAADLLTNLKGVVQLAREWWGLPPGSGRDAQRILDVSSRHAKSTAREYSPEARAYEVEMVSRMHAPLLQQARDWTERYVLPAMRPEAIEFGASRWSLTRQAIEH